MLRIKYALALLLLAGSLSTIAQKKKQTPKTYINNRAPLKAKRYMQLPLGDIQPKGWLREMLLRQKNGATGKLDELYPLVMGKRNGWLGGDGDQWERGPYWIDGLVPLAYILKDDSLIAKAKPWIEWAINSAQPDGYFGPSKDYPHEPGIQRDNSRDWWPKMVMLKVLQQYYDATGDKRVITLLTNYFKYQLKELPAKHLDHWTFWARYRGADNLMVVYWLYNITGDAFLLELGKLIHSQTFDYTDAFLKGDMLSNMGTVHGVNLAQGFKAPVIYYQQDADNKYIDATEKGLKDLRKYNGMAHGMYGADEALHGNNPIQGSELCSAVEMLFSLESMLEITGNGSYADQIEKIAFNALPSQVSDNFMERQYFQQANQIMLTRQTRNFEVNHHGTDLCYGLLTGYPCCTANMHQGWPKFTQNLWYATADKGLAALIYSPSEVTAWVGEGVPVTIKEETNYPFDETIRFTMATKGVSFPLELRIPAWCKSATIKINGAVHQEARGNQVIAIDRAWKNGDVVELLLPMHVFNNRWYENSMSVERGPITYALQIGAETKKVTNDKDPVDYGSMYYEVRPTTPWNYGLLQNGSFNVVQNKPPSNFPWNADSAPVIIKTKGKRIPSWVAYNDMTGHLPYSTTFQLETAKEEEEITLIPYGCTQLHISQFPVLRR